MIPRDFDDQIEEPKAEARPIVYVHAPTVQSLSLPKSEWARPVVESAEPEASHATE